MSGVFFCGIFPMFGCILECFWVYYKDSLFFTFHPWELFASHLELGRVEQSRAEHGEVDWWDVDCNIIQSSVYSRLLLHACCQYYVNRNERGRRFKDAGDRRDYVVFSLSFINPPSGMSYCCASDLLWLSCGWNFFFSMYEFFVQFQGEVVNP